tara:strand:- start:1663 stop:1899 length:237 start_codon:yes stop_codon:yes gene_type:complete
MKVRFIGGANAGQMECPQGQSPAACSLAATQRNADALSQMSGGRKSRRKSRRNRRKSRRNRGKSKRKRKSKRKSKRKN